MVPRPSRAPVESVQFNRTGGAVNADNMQYPAIETNLDGPVGSCINMEGPLGVQPHELVPYDIERDAEN